VCVFEKFFMLELTMECDVHRERERKLRQDRQRKKRETFYPGEEKREQPRGKSSFPFSHLVFPFCLPSQLVYTCPPVPTRFYTPCGGETERERMILC